MDLISYFQDKERLVITLKNNPNLNINIWRCMRRKVQTGTNEIINKIKNKIEKYLITDNFCTKIHEV